VTLVARESGATLGGLLGSLAKTFGASDEDATAMRDWVENPIGMGMVHTGVAKEGSSEVDYAFAFSNPIGFLSSQAREAKASANLVARYNKAVAEIEWMERNPLRGRVDPKWLYWGGAAMGTTGAVLALTGGVS